ncbi:beta-glucosidase [Nonomuraea phyllanthi]|uniref:glycoside hydrolase family 3 protein n=1 Tax=Nonomuraea phyllanthi TaxID=2219224 RepID=UPI0012936955|nr:glycoside hydrolase family 3 C-terminal domain-containing protein [Nonomuraea phyllanthi]QFY10703.1 beta-glucosidase [Nonomuraea phyllanthi]
MAEAPARSITRRDAARLLGAAVAVAVAPKPVAAAAPSGARAEIAPPRARRTDVDALLRRMTLEEKVSLLHGASDPRSKGEAGYLPGVPRLGIPELRLADGPAGVRATAAATALPAPVALAATFDARLAERYGAVMGREGRALGMDVLLAPMCNIVRVPQAGRNFETFGEDPLLAAALVAGEVRGIQGQGLIATVKHLAANNFEHDRRSVDARVDERTLREIYLPAFEAAVRAGAGAVMAAYNHVNGVYAAENRHLLTGVLREEWRFTGWVMSDWHATHSAAPAITAGLDMEMPFGAHFAGLAAAVTSGRPAESVVDTAVRRVLAQLDRFGLLGGGRPRPSRDAAAGARTAREVALAGAVLLRNERDLLPLRRADLADLAVIGPTAASPLAGGGGSARVLPVEAESPLGALRRQAGRGARVRWATGVDLEGVAVPASALSLRRTRKDGMPRAAEADHTGGPRAATDQPGGPRAATDHLGKPQVAAQVDHTGANALPAGSSWTWTGTLTAPETGDYDLGIQGAGGVPSFDGSISLTLDGVRIGSAGALMGGNSSLVATSGGLTNAGATVRLKAGRAVPITIAATGAAGTPLQVRLAWVTPGRRQEALREAVALAEGARTVLVFAFNEGTEGADRTSLALPNGQDPVIEAVAAANPRTAVVLNTGDPVLMPWLERVRSILQMWYPGQEGGDATAALLLGRACPAGKLPVTFPRRAADAPTAPAERYPGKGGTALYGEGVFVGYRHYDAHDVEPLFPFGHGLSYTRFRYDDLAVSHAGGGLSVSFTVANTGRREGVEVAQVYLAAPAAPPVPMPPRALAGFARVRLAPGERRRVTVAVDGRALAYWSDGRWVTAGGRRTVHVGSSSRDLRLHQEVTVR